MSDSKFFYANGVMLGRSTTDVTLIFQQRGVRSGQASDGKLETDVLDSIHVALSPGQAKLLAISLANAIATFEAEVGAIPLSPADRAKHGIT